MDKREHIITHALALFAERGFEGTSIRDIASRADVNVAMINYYFGSKDKLFEALVELRAGYMKGLLEELVHDNSKTDIEKIDVIIESYVNRLLSNTSFHRVLHQELLTQQRERLSEQIVGIFVKNSRNMKTIIESGIRRKSFRKVDPELTMSSIIGTITQVVLSRTMCNSLLGKEENFDPYNDEHFRKRVIKHLKQMIHAHLLCNA